MKFIFSKMLSKLLSHDIQIFLDMKLSRTDEVLYSLFFPCNANYMIKILRNSLAVNLKYFGMSSYSLPWLDQSIIWKWQTYIIWCSGFLATLNSQQYVRAFEMLSKKKMYNKTISKWNTFIKLSKFVSESLKKILQHVMFWYISGWTYSKQVSNKLKIFS